MPQQRLDKWIASQGEHSRKQVKELIRAGKVTINGQKADSPEQKLDGSEDIAINGKRLILQKYVYIMMNKPAGVLCATTDREQKTVLDILPKELSRPGLFPAGRLDKDTEGFVLITDDGDFAHKILSPKNHIPKTYFVRTDKEIPHTLADEFAKGVTLGGGDKTSPAKLELNISDSACEAELTIYEGIYHQVKRMFAQYGIKVAYLRRIQMGNLKIDPDLPPGAARAILHNEIENIC